MSTLMGEQVLCARVNELVEKHGSLRIAGRALRINYAYLARLRSGEKTNPTAATLRKLGLRKIVTYELIRSLRVARMKPEHAAIYHGDIDGDLEGYDGA